MDDARAPDPNDEDYESPRLSELGRLDELTRQPDTESSVEGSVD